MLDTIRYAVWWAWLGFMFLFLIAAYFVVAVLGILVVPFDAWSTARDAAAKVREAREVRKALMDAINKARREQNKDLN